MLKFFKNDTRIVLILIILFLCTLPFFFLHQGLLSIDTGREFYLAQQVANGSVLYKDLFNVYAPFSYQLNAFLFLIFGFKINTLYIAGLINSLVILITIYLIAREFFKENISFLISAMTMMSLVFNTFLYNSNITYSYGMIYALSSFLLALLFLIKYTNTNNPKMAYLSCLFSGLSIINKYEFMMFPLVIIYTLAFVKPLSKKEILKSLLCFILFPIISIGALFIQGLNFNELNQAIYYMISMANSESLKIFYYNMGNIFNPNVYIRMLDVAPVELLLGFLPLINIILFCFSFKKIYQDKKTFIFILATILASTKFIVFMNVNHMGNFFLPIILLGTLVLLLQKEYKENMLMAILIFLTTFFAINDFTLVKYKNYELQTSKGNIYTFRKDGEPIKQISDYINANAKETDKVLVLPEGSFINFITDNKSNNKFHTLIPLYYLDVFGEEKVISEFRKNPTEYVVLLPLKTIEYGHDSFCTYAQNFCEMIYNDYTLEKTFDEVKIYKRKN